MSVVLPAVECGWILGLVLFGVLATDFAALAQARHLLLLDGIWARSSTAGMIALAMTAVLPVGSAIGVAVSAVFAAELRLLGDVPGARVFLVHVGLSFLCTLLLAAWVYRQGGSRRRYAVIIGPAFFMLFGMIFPLLAA